MSGLSKQEVYDLIIEDGIDADDLETDNDGQLIIYTNIYRWKDGSYHEESET